MTTTFFPRLDPHQISADGKNGHGNTTAIYSPEEEEKRPRLQSFAAKKSAFPVRHCTTLLIPHCRVQIEYILRYALVFHPTHAPDLASSHFFLFPNMKKSLAGK